MADNEAELFKLHRAGQDKYAYFLLAAAGAAIAFALSQTKGSALTLSHVPLGLAVAAWGVSFYAGCRHLQHVEGILYTNADLLRAQRGAHPLVGNHPQFVQAASDTLRSILEEKGRKSGAWARAQFHLLVAGAACYVAWHILEMYLRSR